MSFSLGECVGWLDRAGLRWKLVDGDGAPLTDCPQIEFEGATLDSRQANAGLLFCGVQGDRVHGRDFLPVAIEAGVRAAMIEGDEPGRLDGNTPRLLVHDARQALAACARGWLADVAPRVVGITGSNGKTTTKDLLLAALAGQARVSASPGNLNSVWGMPLAILGAPRDVEILVLEMGASEPGEIARLAEIASPSVGCVTNVGAAHLERFGTVEEVARTKGALLAALPADGCAVLWAEDRFAQVLRAMSGCERVRTFGVDAGDIRITNLRQTPRALEFELDGCAIRLGVFGEANALNAAAALTMALELGADPAEAIVGMERAVLSGHRSARIDLAGRVLIDDCYNANPTSVRRAIQSLSRLDGVAERWAILGDMAELGESRALAHREVLEFAADVLDGVLTVGPLFEAASRELDRPANVRCFEAGAFEVVGRNAAELPTGIALLFKGSRSAGLENVLAIVQRHWAGDRAHEEGVF